MLLKQVYLKNSREPLQISYPSGWKGNKSCWVFNEDSDDDEFFVSSEPRFLSEDEIVLAKEFIKNLTYAQELASTGCVLIDESDPLLELSHDQLDALELENGLASSRKGPSGGTRSAYERILIVRERGYQGAGLKMLAGGV